jgi:hypothetical protein
MSPARACVVRAGPQRELCWDALRPAPNAPDRWSVPPYCCGPAAVCQSHGHYCLSPSQCSALFQVGCWGAPAEPILQEPGSTSAITGHTAQGPALLREPGRLQARWACPIRVHGREAAEDSRCVGGSPAGGVLTRTGPQALFLQAPQRQEPEWGLGPGSTAPGPRSELLGRPDWQRESTPARQAPGWTRLGHAAGDSWTPEQVLHELIVMCYTDQGAGSACHVRNLLWFML